MRARLTPPLILLALAFAVTVSAGPKKPVFQERVDPNPVGIHTPPSNDDCANAILINCGNILLSGNTEDATNNYAFVDTVTTCTGYATNGRDVVYKFNVGVGDSLWIDYRNRLDGSIYLVTDCNNIDGTCVAGSDNNSDPNTTESIRYKFTTSGIFYMILDSYGFNTGGLWTASGQLICGPSTPPSNDLCENATTLPCGVFNLSGNTQFAHNYYHFDAPTYYCTGKPAGGKDVTYRLNVTAGDSLWLNYTNVSHNGSAYLVADCNDIDGTCVWGEDWNNVGEVEPMRYKFEYSGIYYLILDARELDSSGAWTMNGGLICANPPPLNDRCADAFDQPYGDFNWSGTTQFATNDYFFSDTAECTDYPSDGREVVYKFTANQGDSLIVHYRSVDSDASLYMVTDCADLFNSCVVGVDNTVSGEYEDLEFEFPSAGTYYLVLDVVDFNAWSPWVANGRFVNHLTAVDPREPAMSLALREISPNPSFGKTNVFYQLPTRAHASLKIYDLQGRTLRTLVDGDLDAGQHHIQWDGRNDHGQQLNAGIYFARLSSGNQGDVRRVIFVK